MSDANAQPDEAEEVKSVAVQEERLPARDTHRARDIKVGRRGIVFDSAADIMAFARMMSDAGLAIPPHLRGNPGACLSIVEDSLRFGLSAFALARETYVVESRSGVQSIAYMAKAVAGIIIANAPLAKRPEYRWDGMGGELKCFVTLTTRDGSVIVHESPEWKDIKVKNSPLWTSDPRQQIGYYTIRAAGRLYFPDALMGLPDEDDATAVDVAPRAEAMPSHAGLAGRLPGPQTSGFDPSHIDREINGDEESGLKDALAASVQTEDAARDEVPTEEADFVAEVEGLLKAASSELEVGAIRSQAQATIDTLPEDLRAKVSELIEAAIARVNKPKGKRK